MVIDHLLLGRILGGLASGGLTRRLRGGMQIFVEAYHFANTAAGWPAWRCMPRRPRRMARRGEAAKDGMTSVAVPNKARGHVGGT